jgi:hypothetical protein
VLSRSSAHLPPRRRRRRQLSGVRIDPLQRLLLRLLQERVVAPAKQRQDQRWRLRRCKQKMPAARKTGVLGLGRRRASRRHEGSGHASDAPWRFFEHFELSSPFCSPSSHVITASASLASIHWCARFAFQPKNSTKSMPAKKQEEEASRLARPRTLPTGSPDGLTPESPRPAGRCGRDHARSRGSGRPACRTR